MFFHCNAGSSGAWDVFLLFLAARIRCSLAEAKRFNGEVVDDYCQLKNFKASCAADEVVVMTRAKYGRMRLGTCITVDYGALGCSGDVLAKLDRNCSGRQSCEFPVAELDGSQPCPADLTPYLEAGYRCQKVVTGPRNVCMAGMPVQLTAQRGYIANVVTIARNLGSQMCPWQIRVKPGQTINVTLIDFSTMHPSDDYDDSWNGRKLRYKYAVIREGTHARTVTQFEDAEREKQVYASTTNVVTIEITSKKPNVVHFLLKYEAVGCATTDLPAGVWIQRHATGADVKCNSTGELWHLTCVDNRWIGRVGNCSRPTDDVQHWNFKQLLDESDSFPFGILAVVAIGVALGILLGGVGLIFAYRCLRTRYTQDTSARYKRDTWINEEGKLMSTYDRPTTNMRMEVQRDAMLVGKTPEVTTSPPCMTGGGDHEPPYSEYGVLPPSGYRQSKGAVHLYESPQFRRKDN